MNELSYSHHNSEHNLFYYIINTYTGFRDFDKKIF